jgi:Leucine-rich repeat (LRR) protein
LISFVCLLTGAAFGRQLQCSYSLRSTTLWPSHARCRINYIDFPSKFESEKHSFSGSSSEKSATTVFQIHGADPVDFIPLDILTEFPNLNGLVIGHSKLPTVKTGLFKTELQKIEYLDLGWNNIETIEANAFQNLVKLQWIRLYGNKIRTLSNRVFRNNPDLIYIDLDGNKITSIVSNFFDSLQKLKIVEFKNNVCVQTTVGCETCLVTQPDLKSKLQSCFVH